MNATSELTKLESKLDELCDIVISVVADEDVKMKRICLRDNIDEDTAKKRIKVQPKDDFYIKNSKKSIWFLIIVYSCISIFVFTMRDTFYTTILLFF